MGHWKYGSDCDQTFTNEWNFSIKYPIRNWYAIKQINQTIKLCCDKKKSIKPEALNLLIFKT